MRKIALIFVLICLLALSIVPAAAQEGSILDIVAGNANLSLLNAAIEAAEPSIAEELGGDGPITLFAPTNSAFRNLAAFLDIEVEDLLADSNVLTNLLRYHVVQGKFFSAQLETFDGGIVPTLLEGTAVGFTLGSDSTITINRVADVVSPFDVNATNGAVHAIDQVVFPSVLREALENIQPAGTSSSSSSSGSSGTDMTQAEGDTVAEIVIGDPDFTTLVSIIGESEADVLMALIGSDPVTLFAPNNDAFDALLESISLTAEEFIEIGGAELLTPILLYHVADGMMTGEEIAALDGTSLATLLEEETLEISVTDDGDVVINEDVTVVTADIEGNNGVVHVIDTVLLPQGTIETLAALGIEVE